MVSIIAEFRVCADCACMIANGEVGDTDDTAAQAEKMRDADIVLSGGCPAEDGGVCLVRHDQWDGCPLACGDYWSAWETCGSCGDLLQGHSCAAVEFAPRAA